MAFTIGQIQAKIDSQSLDARQLINLIADYLQANPGGGSGMVLESYQNSSMSAAVMAYVFRDEDDNIFRVYEPIRNNDVSRSTFAYSVSIDLFPFDNSNWYDATFKDCKLINIGADAIVQDCELEAMIFDGGSATGLQLIRHNHKGSFGIITSTGSELSIIGNGVVIKDNQFTGSACIDNVGAGCIVNNVTAFNNATINFNSKSNVTVYWGIMNSQSYLEAKKNSGELLDFYLGASSYSLLGSGRVGFIRVGESATFGNNGSGFPFNAGENITINEKAAAKPTIDDNLTINDAQLGTSCLVTTAVSISGKNYMADSGTTYELGVSAGNVTAT